MEDLWKIICPQCRYDADISPGLFTSGEKVTWRCPACQTRIIKIVGQEPGRISGDNEIRNSSVNRSRGTVDTYEVYFRDYKTKELHFIGILPERREDPKRDTSQASILRWARSLFSAMVADANAIFVMKRLHDTKGIETQETRIYIEQGRQRP